MSMMVLVLILLVVVGLVVFALVTRNRQRDTELHQLRRKVQQQETDLDIAHAVLHRVLIATDLQSVQLDVEITLNALTKEIA